MGASKTANQAEFYVIGYVLIISSIYEYRMSLVDTVPCIYSVWRIVTEFLLVICLCSLFIVNRKCVYTLIFIQLQYSNQVVN